VAGFGFRRIFRFASLAVIVGVFAWALMPPKEAGKTPALPQPGVSSIPQSKNVKYVIKISPNVFYMPGSIPMGIGEPLTGLTKVAEAFEQRFPDTRIEYINTPLSREFLVTQLASGLAPDIINVNVEDVWVDVQKNWYVALDPYLNQPNEFIREKNDPSAPGYDKWWDMFRYQAISRGKAAPDGLMYCLSYDMVETAVYYNKDVYRKLGLSVPNNWDEFITVCKRVKETPVQFDGEKKPRTITPIVLNADVFVDWANDLIFDQLYNSTLPGTDLLKDPLREPYLQGYLDDVEIWFLYKHGFFTRKDPRYREGFRIMREFRDYCNQNLSVTYDLTRDFVTQKSAMLWQASWISYRLKVDKKLGFEWGTFYLPQFTRETSRFASNVPMCVIGGAANQFEITNSALSDTPSGMPFKERLEKSERLRRVLQFLQFACVPEQYVKVVNEYECCVSNIVGVPTLPLLKPFETILDRPYTTTKWAFTFDLKFYEVFRRLLELYLNDGLTLDQFLDWQISNLQSAVDNLEVRKQIPLKELQAAWDAQAVARATMEGLPDGP
jgi:raffinose/stachyose/melibiose transport system substrate-binding protein